MRRQNPSSDSGMMLLLLAAAGGLAYYWYTQNYSSQVTVGTTANPITVAGTTAVPITSSGPLANQCPGSPGCSGIGSYFDATGMW